MNGNLVNITKEQTMCIYYRTLKHIQEKEAYITYYKSRYFNKIVNQNVNITHYKRDDDPKLSIDFCTTENNYEKLLIFRI